MEIARWLNVGPTNSGWLGVTFGSGLIALICHFCWLVTKNIKAWSLITTPILISFPVQLVLERGNLDSLIFIFLALFCVTTLKETWAGMSLSLCLTFLTIAIKVYPLFGIGGWAMSSLITRDGRSTFIKKTKFAFILLAVTAASTAFALSTIYSKLPPASGAFRSHGLLALGYLNLDLIEAYGVKTAKFIIYILIAGKLLAASAGCGLGLTCFSAKLYANQPGSEQANLAGELKYKWSMVIVMSSIGIATYFVSIGFDYRFIFVLPLLALMAATACSKPAEVNTSHRFIHSVLLIAAFVMVINPLTTSILNASAFNPFEIIDESLLTPFLIFALLGTLARIVLALPTLLSVSSLHDSSFPSQSDPQTLA